MPELTFLNNQGDFILRDADRAPEMVFPLVNAAGMISSLTPRLGGDCKTGQNAFLLAPASAETLHESRASRNFFLTADGGAPWSAAGNSAQQQAARFSGEESLCVRGGLLWQETDRRNRRTGLRARVLSFVPADGPAVELMRVTAENTAAYPIRVTPTAAIPLYGRSADNIRDHRHVTSLLQRLTVTQQGVRLKPTMTFDERGHRPGEHVYAVSALDDKGNAPERFLGPVAEWTGSGSYDWPEALVTGRARWMRPGDTAEGCEMIAALQFPEITLASGEARSWYIALGIDTDGLEYLTPASFEEALSATKAHWRQVGAASFTTGEPAVDAWLRWAAIQPELRRICGCSFMPHHDYGRGGRGWRDLWQDSLALILRDPAAARQDLVRYFAGVRADGTNATIIGREPGEFLADRNNIVRVWMDHGYWPMVTMDAYMRLSGDRRILLEKQPWFCDRRKHRGDLLSDALPEGTVLRLNGRPVESTVLEHLLAQQVTAFFDAGEHGNIRLRGADWNDALDMAAQRGESVAFTAAYAGSLDLLASACEGLAEEGCGPVRIGAALAALILAPEEAYASPETRNACRSAYEEACESRAGGDTDADLREVAAALRRMSAWLKEHLRRQELVGDGSGRRWLNSYRDNLGRQVEGGRNMMLTGQVFALMSGTAEGRLAKDIAGAADALLLDEKRGGYCLNTDFGADAPPLGRQFGFAYGHKENGAVFCHMAVMYAYALLERGLAEEGLKALRLLIRQSMDTGISRIYPGIPEYFDPQGRGMYPWLTGAGSWLMLCLLEQVWGIRGQNGDLTLRPRLTDSFFAPDGTARVRCWFAGREITAVFRRPEGLFRSLKVRSAVLDGQTYGGRIPREAIRRARSTEINIELEAAE